MELGIPLILVAVVLFAVGWATRKKKPQPEGKPQKPSRLRGVPPAPPEIEVAHPRPPVAEFHVVDDEARVIFSVAAPPEPDDVLSELLVGEAIEVTREKQHSLPMSQVNHVVAFGTSSEGPVEMGRATLETPGQLPVRSMVPSILNLSSIAADPLAGRFDEEPPTPPETVMRVREDILPPLSNELRIPKAIDTGLRAQGVDPATMTAGQLVTGMLSLVGYRIEPGPVPGTHFASKGGSRTFIRQDDYQPGGHPEVDSEAINRFAFEFQASQAERGLYVSEKFGPFEIYNRERRDPRVRFVTRERLQNLIDALAMG